MELSILNSLLVLLIATLKVAIIIILFLFATAPMGVRLYNPKTNELDANYANELDSLSKNRSALAH